MARLRAQGRAACQTRATTTEIRVALNQPIIRSYR